MIAPEARLHRAFNSHPSHGAYNASFGIPLDI
jgi:hypothetical protein